MTEAAPVFAWREIALCCTNGDVPVQALVLGCLGVHRAAGDQGEAWTISHIENGLRIAPVFEQIEVALDLCVILEALDGWESYPLPTRDEGRKAVRATPPVGLAARVNAVTKEFLALRYEAAGRA